MKSKGYASFVMSVFAVVVLAWTLPVNAVTVVTDGGTVEWSEYSTYINEVRLISPVNHGDGYDGAMQISVSGAVQYSSSYHFSTNYAVVIQNVAVSNNTDSAQNYSIAALGNLGSDGSTRWHYTSTVAPYYTVSSDRADPALDGSDPVISFLFGDASIDRHGTTRALTYSGDNYDYTVYTVTIPAGETHRYLIIGGVGDIDDTVGNRASLAYEAVQLLTDAGNWPDDFTSFLSPAEMNQVVNWSFEDLRIAPHTNLFSRAYIDGPANPSNIVYTLTNTGSSQLLWTASSPDEWIDVTPASGTLFSGASQEVTVAISSDVSNSGPATNIASIVFSNETSEVVQYREIHLEIEERVFDHFEWDPIGTNRFVGVPFPVKLSAKDITGLVLTNFSDTALLTGLVGDMLTDHSILDGASHIGSASIEGGFTLGYSFTPAVPITVTDVRHYFGRKVSVWTDAGELLVSQNVVSSPGSWVETPLSTPIILQAGVRYRVGVYFEDQTFYLGFDLPNSFADGSIDQSYQGYGAGFPNFSDDVQWWFVDLGYSVNTEGPVSIIPTNTASFVDGVWTGDVTVLEAATNMFLRASDSGGPAGDSNPFNVFPLILSVLLPDAVSEGDPDFSVQVLANYSSETNMLITLEVDNTNAIVIPADVLIPAGQTSVTFSAQVVDDNLLDGTASVTVTASTTNYQPAADSMAVHDNESAALAVSLPQTTYEGAGTIFGAVVLDAVPDVDIVVHLISDNTNEIGHGTAVIPAGQNFASITLPVNDDYVIDGVQTATVEAHVENWLSGYASVFVFDNETTDIDLQLPESLAEGDGVIINGGMVAIATSAHPEINVLLTSSDTTVLDVPAYVTIPAGTNQAAFNIVVVDDLDPERMTTVSVLAQAPGYIPGSGNIIVVDNDAYYLLVEGLSGDLTASDPVSISISAQTMDGVLADTFLEPISITASGDRGAISITPDVLGTMVDGVTTGTVAFANIGNDVILIASGGGITGTSTVFNVIGSEIGVSTAGVTNTLVVTEASASRTMTISNTGNGDLEFEIQALPVFTNLVINGDFEQGSFGFISDYVYTPLSNSPAKGIYTVADDSQTWNGSFLPTMKDHTTGNGQMLMANGSSTGTAVVWQQDVPVVDGVTYDMSAWTASLFGEFLVSLDFQVDGVSVGLITSANLTWKEFSTEWTAKSSGTATLSIVDTQFIPPFLPGNHFAIDDIVFQPAVKTAYFDEFGEGLIARYPFNGNASDESGSGFDGTVVGAVLTTDRFGNTRNAYHFNGVDNNIDLGSMGGFKTVSMWVKQAVRSDLDLYFYHDNFYLYANVSGRGELILADATGGSVTTSVLMDDHVDQWIHLVAISDGINSKVYCNGTNVTVSGSALEAVSTGPVNLGAWIGGYHYMHGDIDDVRIYDHVLSAEEVEALYAESDAISNQPDARWLSADPEFGIIAPGSNMAVAVSFDAAGMVAGDYSNGFLMVTCNDVVSPTNEVPASMYAIPAALAMDAEPDATYGSSNTVSWRAVAGPVVYECEIATDTVSAPLQQSGWQDATNHTFSSLATNQIYYYRARASVESDIGRLEGPWSGWVWSTQVPASADLDADGMPDWWEQLHFGGTGIAGPLTDSDGDGQSDHDEYVAGMDPNNAASCFMINDTSVPTNGQFVVYWDAVTGRVYSVQWKASMTNAFTPMATNIVYPQGSYTDEVHHAEESGFYTIEVGLDDPSAGTDGPPPPAM